MASRNRVDVRPALTPRECEVAILVTQGLSNKEIAKRLSIAENTTKRHLDHIFKKRGLRSRVDLAIYAIKTGLIRLEDV